jgi:uncharacterized protein DUF1592/uncharacterized protein DUF1588/uncharacterized protein DUF1587/uncharacterized protein DUF1585/uncharacterized protein DUF1595/cytochrome c
VLRVTAVSVVAGFVLSACEGPHEDLTATVSKFCVDCHNDAERTAELTFESRSLSNVAAEADVWEKAVRKLRTGMMPPSDQPQPSAEERNLLASWLETSLDDAAAANPNPGRTETFRRLNRTEYQNAIRDLLALDIDATALLPPDESGFGFDNVNVGDLSPALLDRYIAAAQKVSRLAVGSTQTSLQSDIISVPSDATQEEHVAGLPIGTRGGLSTQHTFAQDGEYDIQIRLSRNRNSQIGGLRGTAVHTLQVLLDRMPVATFEVVPPENGDDTLTDSNLIARLPVTAGPHELAATFLKNASSLVETERQPLQAHFNENRHPRLTPAIHQVSVTGPYAPQGASDTPSRRRLFVCTPSQPREAASEEACAEEILSTLMRRAYRRPVEASEVAGPMAFYREARSDGDFDAGIGSGVTAVLVNPAFLFRVERDPEQVSGGTYRISDLELASRLSFFLWSSIPDDELLDAAIRGDLSRPGEVERQARRMLADPRSQNLASNFAGQWLLLRNLEAVSPDPRLYPDFDDNLRQAFRQETELFFDSVLREDRSVLDLLTADYTFVNERLAKHYGIPGVYGSRLRRVELAEDSRRGGLLRHGSLLAVTSYATRTSPVIRGKWVLDNLYGAPPPAPPANVPVLEESPIRAELTMRERLSQHRNNPVCANCHDTIDPVGFALENFDAVGRWRDDAGDNGPMDASGALPGVGEFEGVDGLEAALLSRPELFAGQVTEELLTFALGRGVDYYDAPAIRKILREAESGEYRFSSLILGIVKSVPFQMRNSR